MLSAAARHLLPHPVYRLIRHKRVAAEVTHFAPRQVSHIYSGESLTVELRDPLAAGWYGRDWGALPEIELLRRHGLAAGARVFDLGAHQCVVALILSRIVGPDGHVIAVEAGSHNVRVARLNKRANSAANLTILHAAAADTSGIIRFAEGLNGSVDESSTGWGNIDVPAVTVDDLSECYGPPDVVFVDVEAFEARVLHGAGRTLNRMKTSFFVEVHADQLVGGTTESIVETFRGFTRFIACDAGDGESHRFSEYEAGRQLPTARFFLVAAPESSSLSSDRAFPRQVDTMQNH